MSPLAELTGTTGVALGGPIGRRLWLGLWLASFSALLGLSSGCSDEGDAPPPSDFGYFEPDDFARTDCKKGSLRSLSPAALYHGLATGVGTSSGTELSIIARVDQQNGKLTGSVFNNFASWVKKSNDDLVIRFERAATSQTSDDGQMVAVHLCGVLPSGELVGSYISCSSRGCLEARLVASQVTPLDEPAAGNLTLLGETNSGGAWGAKPFAVNVRVADGLAYVARHSRGFSIVDVRDPAAMVVLSELPTELDREIYNDVKLTGGPGGKRYALLGSNLAGMIVVDVTDPRAPMRVGRVGATPADPAPNVHTLALDGELAFLANTRTGLDIYNIADPLAPTLVGQFSHPSGKGFLHDLYAGDGRVYLNWWDAGMAIVDVSDPTAPRQLGNFQDYGQRTSHSSWPLEVGGRQIVLHGDEQYGSHLRIVDATEGSPTFAKQIASWMTRPAISLHNVMAVGNLAVLAYYQDGVRVVDLSDPTSPRQVAWFQTWDPDAPASGQSFFDGACGIDIDPATRTIYVADIARGLLVLRLASGI